MKRPTWICLSILTAVTATLGPMAGPAGATEPNTSATTPTLESLSWMAGHWRRAEGDERSEELWLPPAGDLMLGLGRSVAGGQTQFFEYLRIEARDGKIAYVASPLGRGTTDFPLREAAGERATFENLAHDFPQRIIYWRDGAGLCARIEGEANGSKRHMEWCWSRVGHE